MKCTLAAHAYFTLVPSYEITKIIMNKMLWECILGHPVVLDILECIYLGNLHAHQFRV